MFLFRALWYLILTIVAISILRGVLGILARFFLNATVGPERRSGANGGASQNEPTQPESLKKDPVCGTFVAPSTALTKERNGRIYFFCSPECRNRF